RTATALTSASTSTPPRSTTPTCCARRSRTPLPSCSRPGTNRALPHAVDALGPHQDRHAALLRHHPVVLVEVVVGAAGGQEDVAQEKPKGIALGALEAIVGPGQLDAALDG